MDKREEILTSKEVMAFLKIGRTKLWHLTKSNGLPAYRVGNGKNSDLRFRKSELLGWLKKNKV